MRLRVTIGLAVLGAAAVAAFAGTQDKPKARFFEMRTYTVNEGKMPGLHARFRDHTNRLFAKHGVEMVGYWTVESGEMAGKQLVFVLAYPSKEAREASWKAFAADPDWVKAKADSEKDGVLVSRAVSTYMLPTDYSPLK